MSRRVLGVGMLVIASFLVPGCSSDDGSTDPQTGSVVINATPDSIDAPWTLAGPGAASTSETGDTTLRGQEPGEYTITWGAVAGWTSPAQQTHTLAAGGTITFAGTYTEVASSGTVVIDAEPNSIAAPWTLAGPDSYSLSGTGDQTVAGVAIGQYTLTWGVVDEWLAPDPVAPSQTLDAGGTITFYGAYSEENPTTGSVIVDPAPDSINAPWFLSNGVDFEYTGSGDSALHGMMPGGYTIEWLDVDYWNTPRQQVLQLVAGDTITFECEYTETDPPPVACFTVSPSIGYVITEFNVSAVCSYDRGGATGDLQLRWDWEDDGVWDYPGGDAYTTERLASHFFDEIGLFTIRLEVRDPAGNSETTVEEIEIEPQTEGRIFIDPNPDLPNAPWEIAGPNAFVLRGNGDHTLYDMPAGDYTIAWFDVEGWELLTSPIEMLTLVAGEQITFNSDYNYLGGQVSLTLIRVEAGTFPMGSAPDALFRDYDETQHQVTLSRPFEILQTEVTNQLYMEYAQWAVDHGYATATPIALYDNLDGSTIILYDLGDPEREINWDGSQFTCINPDNPVQEITWYGTAAFCDWLSLYDETVSERAYDHSTWECNGGDPYSAEGYRLPTEAEWEYACRAGSTTSFTNGDIVDGIVDPVLDVVGWYDANAGDRTHRVAEKEPNAWGLYDMHGNLYEWCTDSYGEYPSTPVVDPVNPLDVVWGVLRGGSWLHSPPECRSASRYRQQRTYSSPYITFRVVRTVE